MIGPKAIYMTSSQYAHYHQKGVSMTPYEEFLQFLYLLEVEEAKEEQPETDQEFLDKLNHDGVIR